MSGTDLDLVESEGGKLLVEVAKVGSVALIEACEVLHRPRT